MTLRRLRIVSILLLALLMAMATLVACGKSGEPLPPDGKETNFPRQYPSY